MIVRPYQKVITNYCDQLLVDIDKIVWKVSEGLKRLEKEGQNYLECRRIAVWVSLHSTYEKRETLVGGIILYVLHLL